MPVRLSSTGLAFVILAAACTTVLMAAMLRLFDVWKMPVLTAPFVFTALCWWPGAWARPNRPSAPVRLVSTA